MGLSPNPVFRRLSVVGPVWDDVFWSGEDEVEAEVLRTVDGGGVLVGEEEVLDEDEYAAREDRFIRKAPVWRRDLEKTIFC